MNFLQCRVATEFVQRRCIPRLSAQGEPVHGRPCRLGRRAVRTRSQEGWASWWRQLPDPRAAQEDCALLWLGWQAPEPLKCLAGLVPISSHPRPQLPRGAPPSASQGLAQLSTGHSGSQTPHPQATGAQTGPAVTVPQPPPARFFQTRL